MRQTAVGKACIPGENNPRTMPQSLSHVMQSDVELSRKIFVHYEFVKKDEILRMLITSIP